MSKKHSPKTNGLTPGKLCRPQTAEESAAIKVGRNQACPCGKTRKLEVFVKGKEEPNYINVSIKYKNCCLGKHLFFTDADATRLGLKTKDDFLKQKELEKEKTNDYESSTRIF